MESNKRLCLNLLPIGRLLLIKGLRKN